MLVIGSNALEVRLAHRRTTPKDRDYIMTYDTIKEFIKKNDHNIIAHYPIQHGKKYFIKTKKYIIEIEIAWDGSSALELMNIVRNDTETINLNGLMFPSIHVLYALKMSHRYLKNSPHFLKTMDDIHFLRDQGARIKRDYEEWFTRREKETYTYSHPALNTKKNDFFKDELFYVYDHDTIHEAVKIGDKPAYVSILKDGAEVECDKWKFLGSPTKTKLSCALEECYVLALERSLIPNKFKVEPSKAFDTALMKVCTSITSGWFREWCWENYKRIKESYDESFVQKFHDALKTGNIKPFKGV